MSGEEFAGWTVLIVSTALVSVGVLDRPGHNP